MPTTVTSTIRSSGGDYSLLSTWEAAKQGDIVSADQIQVAECYDDWPSGLSDTLTIDGSTTDSTRYMKVTVAAGHRHDGTPGTGFFAQNSGNIFRAADDYTLFEYLDAEITGNNACYFVNGASNVRALNCIARGSGAESSAYGFRTLTSASFTTIGCLAVDLIGTGFIAQNYQPLSAYNCVAANTSTGFSSITSKTLLAKNCFSYNNTTNYSGTFDNASTNNATSTGSDDAPGGSSVYGVTSAAFVNAASNDFHLASGSVLIGAGVNLYSTFTTDIDGDTWPSSGAWDIGFDYRVASGVTGTGAATTAATTASGTGTLTHKGTGSLTTGATTASGTGVISHAGTGAITTGAVTASGAGVLSHVGTGALTTSVITVDGTGTVTAAGEITGSGAIAIAAATVAGSGTLAHTGTGALSVSPIVLAGAGVLTHTGTGDLTTGATTASGTGTVLGEITGTGVITIGAAQVSGYDVLASVSGGGIGHGGMAKRRPRLIRIEEAENPEEVIAEIEAAVAESVKKPGRKPKTIKLAEKPIVEPSVEPNQWVDYYEQQAQRTREQDQLNDLIAQAKLKIKQLQAEDTFRRIQKYEAMVREEEELMLLLMAA